MNDNETQGDFFEGQFLGKKHRKSVLLSRYSNKRLSSHIKVPLEYIIIFAIVILVLLIISYAVGVENGKKGVGVNLDTKLKVEEKKEIVIEEKGKEEKEIKEDTSLISDEISEEERIKPEEKIILENNTGYVIQLASFKNEKSAKEEVEKLSHRKINACMAQNSGWYQVYTSGYKTFDQAKEAKRKFITSYKDCYIRQSKK